MKEYMDRRKKRNMNAVMITVLLLVFIVTSTTATISPICSATGILAYGKPNSNSNITEGSLDIQDTRFGTTPNGER
jgi:hypothetical protein